MNQVKESIEILKTKVWNVDPRFAHSVRPMIEGYLNREQTSAFDADDSNHGSGWFALKSKGFKNGALRELPKKEDLIVTDDPKWDMTQHWWDEEGPLISPEDEFINVIDITSSVTRNGGWCSAGSIEHRDQMIFASKFPNCIGHLFIIDTPGGSAFSKNDYQQGIAAARAAGQPVLCWIDGMCCSAGVAAACQTDEVYVQHELDEVGCIGTMAAFYTLADGTQDDEGYVYHELYDPESFEKNLEFRELANNGNADPLLQDLAEDGLAFRTLVKENRPAIKEEMLHGKVFKARDLMGILVDGVKSYEEVIDRFVELRGGAALISHVVDATEDTEEEPKEPEEPISPKDPDDKCGDKPKKDTSDDEDDKCGDPDKKKDNNNNPVSGDQSLEPKSQSNKMKQYENINAALGVEALAVTEDGSFYCNGPLAETLEAKLGEAKQNEGLLAANTETVANLNAKVAELKAEADKTADAVAQEKASLEAQLAEAQHQNEELSAKLTDAQEQKANSEDSLSGVEETNKNLEAKVAELEQQIADLNTQLAEKQTEVEELSKKSAPAATPAPSAEQQEENKGDERKLVQNIYSDAMTIEEKAAAREARMAYLRSIK